MWSRSKLLRTLPELFPKAAAFNEDDRTSRKFQLRKFLWEYIQFYFPLVAIEFTILYLVVFSPNYRIDTLILNEVFIGAFVFGFCWIVSELRYKYLPYSWKSNILYWYIISNLVAISWMTVIVFLIVRATTSSLNYEVSEWFARLVGGIILSGVYALHLMFNLANHDRSGRIMILICCFIIFGACYSFGLGYIGGTVLRIAGLGGGTSLSYRVGQNPPAKGCLVWPSSSYFVISDRSDNGSCISKFEGPFSGSPSPKHPVHMFGKGSIQILTESGLP